MIILRHRRWRSFCLVVFLILLILSCLTQLIVFSSTIYCSRWKVQKVITKLCEDYEEGVITGEMCNKICKPSEKQFIIKSCGAQHLGKDVVFTAEYGHNTIIMKSAHNEIRLFESFPLSLSKTSSRQNFVKTATDFSHIIADMINVYIRSEKLNFSNFSGYDFLRSILITDFGFEIADFQSTSISKDWMAAFKSLWLLLQQREYLMFKYLENSKLFPRVIGSCGHLYAVDFYRPVSEFIYFDWELRTKIALGIVSWLERAQYYFSEPLRICDIKFIHFGIAKIDDFDLKFLDADDVYFQSTLNSIVTFNNACLSHQDCSYFHCLMECDINNTKCDTSEVNNNLQVAYSKLFSSSIPKSIFFPNVLHSLPISKIDNENLRELFSYSKLTQHNFENIKLFLKSILKIK